MSQLELLCYDTVSICWDEENIPGNIIMDCSEYWTLRNRELPLPDGVPHDISGTMIAGLNPVESNEKIVKLVDVNHMPTLAFINLYQLWGQTTTISWYEIFGMDRAQMNGNKVVIDGGGVCRMAFIWDTTQLVKLGSSRYTQPLDITRCRLLCYGDWVHESRLISCSYYLRAPVILLLVLQLDGVSRDNPLPMCPHSDRQWQSFEIQQCWMCHKHLEVNLWDYDKELW